jgi:hypothetical protein
MAVSKLDVAVMVVMAAILLRVEHDHRVVIGGAAPAEAALQAVCPATDDVPYSADCIRFIEGSAVPDGQGRQHVLATLPDAGAATAPHAPACPASNENAPYSASCIKFLSGWYWQADPMDDAR